MMPPLPMAKQQRSKRKAAADKEKNRDIRKRRKTKGKGVQQEELEKSSSDEQVADAQCNPQPRRSGRIENLRGSGYWEPDKDLETARAAEKNVDDDMGGGKDIFDHTTAIASNSPASRTEIDDLHIRDEPTSTLEIETEEDEKPKPILQLKYQGFSIFGHCLCIVIEPWPPIRSVSKVPSVLTVNSLPREPSIAPLDFSSTAESSAQPRTPLFLPDDTDRERSETPAPFQDRINLRIPSFHNTNFPDDSDDPDGGGMMEFSQVLNAAGDFRAGAADDDEDMEGGGAIFFGDADETREF